MVQYQFSPQHLPLTELEAACRRETERYRRDGTSDTQFCLEIFHRALRRHAVGQPPPASTDGDPPVYADEEARTTLVNIYTEFIKANINRIALHTFSVEDIVQQVWLRFWRAANQGLHFETLESALYYLKRTVVTTLITLQRTLAQQRREESLGQVIETAGEGALVDNTADLFDTHTRRRFWTRCREILTDVQEYRIFWMKYGIGLAPREIAALLRKEDSLIRGRTPSARLVSDTLDRCFKRLSQDPEIRDLLHSD